MPMMLLYIGLALLVLVGVMLAVPEEGSEPPPDPKAVMMELQKKR